MGLSFFVMLLATVPPVEPATGGGMDPNTIITILFGAGGAGALAGLVTLIQAIRKGKLENEENLIARLNADSKQQGDRADKAEADLIAARRAFEAELAVMRQQRDRARDRAAEFRTALIQNGFQNVPTLDDLYS